MGIIDWLNMHFGLVTPREEQGSDNHRNEPGYSEHSGPDSVRKTLSEDRRTDCNDVNG